MAQVAPSIPTGPIVDANGNLTTAWQIYFQEINRLIALIA